VPPRAVLRIISWVCRVPASSASCLDRLGSLRRGPAARPALERVIERVPVDEGGRAREQHAQRGDQRGAEQGAGRHLKRLGALLQQLAAARHTQTRASGAALPTTAQATCLWKSRLGRGLCSFSRYAT